MEKKFLLGLLGLLLMSCSDTKKNKEGKVEPSPIANSRKIDFSGSYVTSDYQNRNQGSDWVGVTIKNLTDSTIHITIRSRADIKKPTCTFDADALQMSNEVYKSVINGTTILYSFQDDQLRIQAQSDDGEGLLYYYCSGGATLANTYTRINGSLDDQQVDKSLQN